MNNYLPSDYEQFIATSRYARWREEDNRRETWPETVQRFMTNVVGSKVDGITYLEIEQAILSLEIMPSMRGMMTAGAAMDRDNTSAYNCAYLAIDDIRAFDEAMFILLCGTGVGFSVERQYIQKLPEVPQTLFANGSVIFVKDSKEGWAKALRKLVAALYDGVVPTFDTSMVRPAGARLKTFGGRASGPGPLRDLYSFVVNIFTQARGRKLTSEEVHDILCKIGEVVVVGGVRRSAMISLSNLSDNRMRHAKSGNWWENNGYRALANNSVTYTEKPDMKSFLREWTALVESGSGERGIFSRPASVKQAAKNGRRNPNFDFGTNPCCFSGDMQLLTKSGYKNFSHLAGHDVDVVNLDGTITRGSVWSSGYKPTVNVTFVKRPSIRVTDDHIFMTNTGEEVQAKDLQGKRLMPYIEMADSQIATEDFLAGFILGDGNLNRANSEDHKGIEVYFNKTKDADLIEHYCPGLASKGWYSREAKGVATEFKLPKMTIGSRGYPESLHTVMALQGLYSANGSVIKYGRVALKSIDHSQILGVKTYLANLGINSNITTNKPTKVQFSNGEYICKESFDLNISQYESLLLFTKLVGFGQSYKREQLKDMLIRRAPYVVSVVEAPVTEVFDFSEPLTHWGVVEGFVVHNSEIILRPNQFCNLTEVVVRATDTLDSLKRKVKLATILGTIQSTFTHFPYLRKIWKDNTEEERLLGVSLTGIMDSKLLVDTHRYGDLENVLDEMKQVAITTNSVWSSKLGIQQSTAITCVN